MLRLALVLILIVVVARAFWRVVDGIVEGLSGRPRASRSQSSGHMVRDPVCGTFVLPDRAVTLDVGSHRFCFCSPACRDKYRARTA